MITINKIFGKIFFVLFVIINLDGCSSNNFNKYQGLPIPTQIFSPHGHNESKCSVADGWIRWAKMEKDKPKGNAGVFSDVGYFYLTGCGVNKDYDEAKYWLELGANNGDFYAIHNLAWLYQNGLGGKQDYKMAANLYLKIINNEQLTPIPKKNAKANLELIPNYAGLVGNESEKIIVSKAIDNQKNKNIATSKTTNLVDKNNSLQSKGSSHLVLEVSTSEPDAQGMVTIKINTNEDTASLTVNGVEEGSKNDGKYEVNRLAKIGQKNTYVIIAKDIFGLSATKVISVDRKTSESKIKYVELNPALVKTQPNKDAIAIIIGIADYKNLPRADFANDDARVFYDYAIRALGVRAENIKLLVDADAGQEEIYKAFKTWLPARVRATTEVYVYYSGHGITTNDGQSLYLLPQRTDRDLIEETAIAQSKINAAIQAAKPKSVTIFLDSCYSGVGRTGATLLASARPIAIKSTAQVFPSEFTVISASTAEQISSSSNELKHGIFSYYLMRGMEGEADTNKDGKITMGEMHSYLMDNVTRQASLANRVQNPQLTGDANRVLIGK